MTYISLESINFPGRFMRHQNFLGELSVIQDDAARRDATFLVRDAGRVEGRAVVMLRAINFPLRVFRHQNFRLRIDDYDRPLFPTPSIGNPRPAETTTELQLREDATFDVNPGHVPSNRPGIISVSFRSFNVTDSFIRHRDGHLVLTPVTSDLDRRDATWLVVAPLAPMPRFPNFL